MFGWEIQEELVIQGTTLTSIQTKEETSGSFHSNIWLSLTYQPHFLMCRHKPVKRYIMLVTLRELPKCSQRFPLTTKSVIT